MCRRKLRIHSILVYSDYVCQVNLSYLKPTVGNGAVAAAGCCITALLTERLLRAVDDGVRRACAAFQPS